jgi:kynurenine formamidase
VERIKRWEKDHGPIPIGAFVALRTDWSKRWPNGAAMANKDASGVAHYPGWSLAALKYLYDDRKTVATGHETTDTDPGLATSKDDYSLESCVLSHDHYQIELLTNLDQYPRRVRLSWRPFPSRRVDRDFRRGSSRVCRRCWPDCANRAKRVRCLLSLKSEMQQIACTD